MKELLRYMARMIRLMSLVGLMGLVGCSDDPSPDRQWVTVEARSCSTDFDEVGDNTRTRSWTLPDGYVLYSGINSVFAEQDNLMKKSVRVFFTKGTDYQERELYYWEYENKWYMNTEIENTAPYMYQLYGFIPVEDADGATISPLNGDDYTNGAELTIRGIKTVTPSDVCVIIGAKDGNEDNNAYDENVPYEVSNLESGKFDVTFNSGLNAKNYIFLLFDHIYSALRFSFSVDPTYNNLRTIRLRKLELMAYSDDQGGGVPAKHDATIILHKNPGASPVASISFTAVSGAANVAAEPLYDDDDGLVLSTTASSFVGRFVPGVNTYFKLRSTYDVYDKNVTAEHPEGNLIRKGCIAENSFDLRDNFGSHMEVNNGVYRTKPRHCYTYNMKVQPTYLYVLSEPDVDNPTVVLN